MYALLLGAIVSLGSCKKDEGTTPVDNSVKLAAVLSGQGEKPNSNSSAATGTFVGSLDKVTRILSYTVTYDGISPAAGHLHRISPNSATGTGGVEIGFTSLTSPISGTALLASQTRVDSMLTGFYYANLHTSKYPGGEIRGDIKLK